MAKKQAENFQFQQCQAADTTGNMVTLPGGFATVSRGKDYIADSVFFPSHQTMFDLEPGQVALLESQGKARRS
jgi:hypothetical protein